MWISFGPKPEKEPRVVRAARVVGLVRERGVRVTLGALPSRSFLAHVRLRDQVAGASVRSTVTPPLQRSGILPGRSLGREQAHRRVLRSAIASTTSIN
jgi:hypothetical protein